MVEFLRHYPAPAEGGEIRLLAHTLLSGLCQVQEASVREVGTLVEVTLKRAVEEGQVILVKFRSVAFAHEPVLLVDYGEVRKDFDCLAPSRVHRLIFLRGHGEKFREAHLKGHRYVGVL